MSFRTSRFRTLAIAFAGSLLLSAHAGAAVTYTVDSILDQIDDDTSDGICHTAAGTCTLRAAVMSANKASGAGATIMLPAGTYTLSIPSDGLGHDYNGGLFLTAPSSGSPVISIIGAGASVTIIDAQQIDRVLLIDYQRTAAISEVTLRNGFVAGFGAGISNNGTLTVTNSTISDNWASGDGNNGGGIYVTQNGTLTLTGVALSGNVAGGNGGGIYVEAGAPVTLDDVTISGNDAGVDGGGVWTEAQSFQATHCTLNSNNALLGSGGGIYSYPIVMPLVLSHCTLSGNSAALKGGGIASLALANLDHVDLGFNHATSDAGGGIYSSYSLSLDYVVVHDNTAGTAGGGIASLYGLTIDHSTIRDNVSTKDGGGLLQSAASDQHADISRTTISGNIAHTDGGGISTDSVVFMINSTVALNTSDRNGGGLYVAGAPQLNVNLYNSTVVYNGADQDQSNDGAGGGVFISGTGGNGFNIYNTILAGNVVSNQPLADDCYTFDNGFGLGALKTHARNLFGSTGGCNIVQISGSYATLNSVALLGPLQGNGGPTQTIALRAGSNAIDGASVPPVTVCRDSQSVVIAVDQRGYPRSDGVCDVGAYEYNDIFADGFEGQ